MILLIDIGNSRIKACYVRDDTLINHVASEYLADNFHEILENLSLNKPEQIIVACVAGDSIRNKLVDWCVKEWQLKPVFVSVDNKINGLTNAYHEPQQLGVDRWVSMLACRQLGQGYQLLVSFGTATTLDAIDDTGQHLGGMIVPGLALMQSALIRNTQQIRPVTSNLNLDDSLFGKSTYEGLQKGAIVSLIALVESVYSQLQRQYEIDVDCIITGGFADQLRDKLTIEYNQQSHIVLMGLNHWRKHK